MYLRAFPSRFYEKRYATYGFRKGVAPINLLDLCMLYGLFVGASMVFSQRPVSLSSASLQPLVRL